jgi:hypothetical protein
MEHKSKHAHDTDELIFWFIPEFDKHERERIWYISAGAIAILMIIFAFITSNFLFAVIVIIAAFIFVIRDGQDPDLVKFSITYEGIHIGNKFYDYDELKDFSVIFKPKLRVKKLYFEFKNTIKPRLSIPLIDTNPLIIREILLKYLPEDLERTDEPTSEGLAKLLRIG